MINCICPTFFKATYTENPKSLSVKTQRGGMLDKMYFLRYLACDMKNLTNLTAILLVNVHVLSSKTVDVTPQIVKERMCGSILRA